MQLHKSEPSHSASSVVGSVSAYNFPSIMPRSSQIALAGWFNMTTSFYMISCVRLLYRLDGGIGVERWKIDGEIWVSLEPANTDIARPWDRRARKVITRAISDTPLSTYMKQALCSSEKSVPAFLAPASAISPYLLVASSTKRLHQHSRSYHGCSYGYLLMLADLTLWRLGFYRE